MHPKTRLASVLAVLLLLLLSAGLSTVSQEPHQDLGASTGRVSALSVPITTTTTSSSSSGSRSLQAVQQFSAPCSHLRNGPLDPGVTSCLQWQQAVGCGLLEAQGYIAGAGVQSFTPDRLTGNFTAPAGACGSTSISLVLRRTQQQQQQQLVFDAGSRTALAVIVKGAAASTYLLARGVTKGVISLDTAPTGIELCLAPPGEGAVTATQTATYTPRLAPGSVAWQLKKSVQLPPAFSDGVVHMIQGDSVEALWTLSATKTGEEATYQGVLSGTVSITNSKPVPVAVYGVLTAVKGGPSAVVSCGPTSMPFNVPACTTTRCSFTATYPQPPGAGEYKAATTVQYQQPHSTHVAVATVETAFKVSSATASAASLAPGAAKVPPGQAAVSDSQLPGQVLTFTGTGQQSFVTMLSCPPSGAVITSASLLAATGQELTASASVQKNCQQLDVRLVEVGEPVVARWHWSVQQAASATRLGLRSVSTLYITQGQTPVALDADAERLPTTEDVTYTVHVTRSLPKGTDGRVAPFTLTGKVLVTNPAPTNARLAAVTVSISDPSSNSAQSAALTVAASCPMLVVASGQSLMCSWTATPTFNPVGGAVVAVARYLAKRNGAGPSGDTVDFASAPVTVGDNDAGTAALTDISPDGLATFGGTFYGSGALVGSLSRTLKQWMGSGFGGSNSDGGSSSSPAVFNPADFLGRVWGHTGATTIVSTAAAAGTATAAQTTTFAPAAALSQPQMQRSVFPGGLVHTSSSMSSMSSSYAAPAPVTTLPGGRSVSHLSAGGSISSLQQVQLAPAAGAAAASAHGLLPDQHHAGTTKGLEQGPNTAPHSATPVVDPHRRMAAPPLSTQQAVSVTSTSAPPPPPPAAVEPAGLLDDCVELSHDLGFEPGLLTGRVVSGRPPTGRICNSTTFVYSVRYGPYDSCSTGSRAATVARLLTADTRRVGSSIAEVEVAVKGCRPGLQAVLAAARPAADVSATWSVQVQAQHAVLKLKPGQSVNNSYSVSYARRLEASAPRLYVVLSLRNTGRTTALIGEGMYSVNMTCGHVSHARSNPFACASNKVAAGSAVNCSVVVPLACAAGGSLQAQVELSTGQTVQTPLTAFEAPDLEQLIAAQPSSRSGCIKASYGDAGSSGGAGDNAQHKSQKTAAGKLVAGEVPAGRLCRPAAFNFTRQFGPFATCRHMSAHVKAGFSTPDGVSRSETLLTGLQVTGCSNKGGAAAKVQAASGGAAAAKQGSSNMRLAKQQRAVKHAVKSAAATGPGGKAAVGSSLGISKAAVKKLAAAAAVAVSAVSTPFVPPRGSCVYRPHFWKHCMLGDLPTTHPACDVIAASLPGGLGPRTPFFPYRKQPQIKRTYRQLMVAPKGTGDQHVDEHFAAAKVYIAAQLNQFAGVTMPERVREAYVQLGRDYFSVYDDRSAAQLLPSQPQVQRQLAAAARVLADFVGGKHPGLPTCAALQAQQIKQHKHKQKQ